MSVSGNNQFLRHIPAVDELLNNEEIEALAASMPRSLLLDTLREVIGTVREEIREGCLAPPREHEPRQFLTELIASRTVSLARIKKRPNLRRVLNLTGVVLHTNLGRAVLPAGAIKAINDIAGGYSNLEINMDTGKRGSRYASLEGLLAKLTGAESAMVVNNNAAAVLLALSTLAKGREVIVSRGQLVEIGGSFRIPEVMAQSGARLVEVGTTNKTYPEDYKRAITSETALLLHVHTSNYRIVGFTRETSVVELVQVGREFGLPVMSDLGSGSLFDVTGLGLPAEPTVQEVIHAGPDVVTFSGDKLLGGPQAGIIAGKKALLERMKKNPLTRAVRIDKLTVAALEATLREYLNPSQVKEQIPTLHMLGLNQEALKQKADRLLAALQRETGLPARFTAVETLSAVGGGALPTAHLPSWAVAIEPVGISATVLAAKLRAQDPAVIGKLQDDKLLLDVRTLLPGEETMLIEAVSRALAQRGVAD